ncbi:MAG: aminodeoxychorismate/anthranilate synthase component II [Fusobacterium sp.]|uniref:anthranilate synthase component II n=1 Tax=Fusobacterium sp. TaxID=68766 RepID=UPI0026DC91C2|nr:aminodeoxychorismate/anthranilate synthase component II [Fusobacterium sp.]MDO4690387.1 aminodeoxychorismate/anthranilate synthase component II [Fusobacterium sp.]
MFIMIDNYDSFVYNLVSYFMEEKIEISVIRNDQVNLKTMEKKIQQKKIEGIIISPGPKSPKDCGLCNEIIEKFYKKIPIFGVCLGHQIIGHVFGANVTKAFKPMHGKVENIKNNGKNIFENLPINIKVTRYHSLIIKENLSADFEIDAETKDGIIMAISHKKYPLYGVQFHPEAVLTEYGHEMIRNFIKIAKKWRNENYD